MYITLRGVVKQVFAFLSQTSDLKRKCVMVVVYNCILSGLGGQTNCQTTVTLHHNIVKPDQREDLNHALWRSVRVSETLALSKPGEEVSATLCGKAVGALLLLIPHKTESCWLERRSLSPPWARESLQSSWWRICNLPAPE